MLTRMDPIPAKGHTLLIFSEPSTTTTQIYPPLRHGDPDPSSEALYVVSETDRARRVNVRRGPREAEAPVAELRYSGRKGVSVQWKDADVSGTVKFTEWMTRANKRGGTHQVTIAGEEYEWSELRDGGAVVCYPVRIIRTPHAYTS